MFCRRPDHWGAGDWAWQAPSSRPGSKDAFELRAGAELELAIGAAQVHLDRLDRDEERLRDLLVTHPVGRQLCHAPLARGQCVKPRLEDLSRPRAGGGDLLVRPPGEPECADPQCEVNTLPEPLACLGPPVRAAERGAEVDEGARVLEAGFRAREHLDRLPEQPGSCRAALNETERAQGGADGLRVTPAAGERELFGGERTRLVVPIEQPKAFGGPAAPWRAPGIVERK